MSEHLTENEIERYAGRSLDPADLLRVDEHLTTCADCRQKALTKSGLQASLAGIRGMKPSDAAALDHPDPEQLAGYVDNTLDAVDREIVEGHLEICESCAAEVAELRSFQSVLSECADQTYAPALAAGRFQRMESGTTRRPALRFAPAFAMAATLLIAAAVVWQVQTGHGHHAPADQQVARVTEPAPIVETPTAPAYPPSTTEKPTPSATPPAPAPTYKSEPTPSAVSAPKPEASMPSLSASKPEISATPPAFAPNKPAAEPVAKSAPTSTGKVGNGLATAAQVNGAITTGQIHTEADAPRPQEKSIAAPPPQGGGQFYTPPTNGPIMSPTAPAAPPAPKPAPGPLHPDDMMAMSAPVERTNRPVVVARKNVSVAALPDSVKRVIASGHLDLDTPEIRDLVGPAVAADNIGASMATFPVTSPVSTALLTDRPAFTWEQAKSATGYQVTITDASGSSVDESPIVASTTWKADKPLPRGQVLRWQVKAMANGSVLETAPDGGARFRILDADRADQIRDAQKTFADQPMALGILYAQAGMLDDAERAFTQARRQDPQNELVPKLMADLKAVRNSGL